MQISVKSNVNQVLRELKAVNKEKVPTAIRNALNDTARTARKDVQAAATSDLDRPTPWTVRGILFKTTDKTKLTSSVFIDPDRAKYLKWQIDGGIRTPEKRAIALPSKTVKTNVYGNLGRKKINNMMSNKKLYASKTVDGTPGIYRLYKNKPPVLQVQWLDFARYKKRFGFYKAARRSADKNITPNLKKQLRFALRAS